MSRPIPPAFAELVRRRLSWDEWQRRISSGDVQIDRPRGSTHPRHPEIRYPIDYGFLKGTLGSDGEDIDLFIGTHQTGLAGAILTSDYRRGDLELKFMFNVSPAEIYLINGFINFDRTLMEGVLCLRYSMRDFWDLADADPA